MRRLIPLLLVVLGVCAMGAALAIRSEDAAAAGPCATPTALTGEEQQFLGLLGQWRATNLAGAAPLQLSGALNGAAAWFAQDQIDHLGSGGHIDSLGRSWPQRAADCGYGPYAQGSGEGIYAVAASGVLNIGPNEALAGITYPGSGVYIVAPSQTLPAKCVGVAVRRNAASTKVAWVAVIAQYPASQPCPGTVVTAGPTTVTSTATAGTATPTRTATPILSPTPTKTPSPTPIPTPVTFRAFVPYSARD